MTEYLISDTHYFHTNIINFESNSRGHFKTAEEMNEEMIKQWNRIVLPEDTVYHLGDISINIKYDFLVSVLSRLNGEVVLIQGNHDDTKNVKKLLRDGLIKEWHPVGVKLKRSKQSMWLSHYPMSIGRRPNMWSVHGHIHSQPSNEINQINVGVDSPFMSDTMNIPFGQPISLDKVVDYMISNPIEPYPRREK